MNLKYTGKPTLKDISQKTHLDVSTVSRVLNNTLTISHKVRLKMLKISKEIGYTPNSIARALVTKCSYAIGLVVPDFTYMAGVFFQEIMIGIELEVERQKGDKQIGVIGYDNMETNDYLQVPLTSVDQKGRKMGETAGKMILVIIEKSNLGRPLMIKPEWVVRQSGGCT